MGDASRRVMEMDLSLFEEIDTQTTDVDRKALLAAQRAVMNRHDEFAYLEIGSHLGGSIQPYLVTDACTRIYSIDPRPLSQPDERLSGHIEHYPDNSTTAMLNNLGAIDADAIAKISCFESDAGSLDPADFEPKPALCFIDGEHTTKAAKVDYEFCRQVVAGNGVVLFHDFTIVINAIFDILSDLESEDSIAFLIDGSVFGIFHDPSLVLNDPYLARQYRRRRHLHHAIKAKFALKRVTPEPLLGLKRSLVSTVRR